MAEVPRFFPGIVPNNSRMFCGEFERIDKFKILQSIGTCALVGTDEEGEIIPCHKPCGLACRFELFALERNPFNHCTYAAAKDAHDRRKLIKDVKRNI